MSNEIPVTHWKPILNFHVLNEKVDFERKAIPGEIYPFIRYIHVWRIHFIKILYSRFIPKRETMNWR